MESIISFAVSQANSGAGQPSCAQSAMPLLLMFAVFYFFLIRPQQKRQKEHREMLGRLKKGDRVVTNGGLIGTVHALTEQDLTLEVSEKVKVKVMRSSVSLYASEASDTEKKDK
ncbi:preprotein translocase subunit YajC [Myxococcota bacterium]|nr:preprotein translocase subunit YajC [Myxococcota bacterium]MBU1429139.1 preprotein translocase subunit YajC [Myxococcota bacterium]MBU1897011.1 preprotein translocase subunit YajC [Myxococcota bacterium]